jgi:hypothetical protein
MPQYSCRRAPTLVLDARAENNDMKSGLCQVAMVQFIFWREYLSCADKQEGEYGSPQFSLDLRTGIGCHVATAMSPSVEHHVLGTGFPGPMQRDNRVVQQLSSWTVAISLRAVAQKLQWLCSFPRGFGGPEGFPHLPFFYFLWKSCLDIFLFCSS